MNYRNVFFISILLCSIAWGQNAGQAPSGGAASTGQQSMPGMDMSGHDMSNMKDTPMGKDTPEKEADSDASAHVKHSMEATWIWART